MLRVVLLLLGVGALVWLLRRSFQSNAERSDAVGAEPKPEVDELVRCAHCGVHVPRIEAQTRDGRHFCSREHAQLGGDEDRS